MSPPRSQVQLSNTPNNQSPPGQGHRIQRTTRCCPHANNRHSLHYRQRCSPHSWTSNRAQTDLGRRRFCYSRRDSTSSHARAPALERRFARYMCYQLTAQWALRREDRLGTLCRDAEDRPSFALDTRPTTVRRTGSCSLPAEAAGTEPNIKENSKLHGRGLCSSVAPPQPHSRYRSRYLWRLVNQSSSSRSTPFPQDIGRIPFSIRALQLQLSSWSCKDVRRGEGKGRI